MALPARGFVWLSAPKCASTAVEEALDIHSAVVLRHEFKHLNYTGFTKRIEPMLLAFGHQRSSYEVVCLFREPVSWLESWWRYRARPEILETAKAHNYTGDMSFDEFVTRYVDRHPSLKGIGRPARFCSYEGQVVGVDRLLRYESTEVWQRYLSSHVGVDLGFRRANASERRPEPLDPGLRRRAEEFFAPEYEIYAHLEATGDWAPPRDHALAL
jgi:hypothetical protein